MFRAENRCYLMFRAENSSKSIPNAFPIDFPSFQILNISQHMANFEVSVPPKYQNGDTFGGHGSTPQCCLSTMHPHVGESTCYFQCTSVLQSWEILTFICPCPLWLGIPEIPKIVHLNYFRHFSSGTENAQNDIFQSILAKGRNISSNRIPTYPAYRYLYRLDSV